MSAGAALLAPKARELLESFAASIAHRIGDLLQAVVLYGDYAREPEVFATSTIDLAIVVAATDTQTLDGIRDELTRLRDLPLTVMVLTRNDVMASADVFPVKFLDMQCHHVLLCGVDVIGDVIIDTRHLRLRAEQELKNLMLRLRALYVRRAHDARQLHVTIGRAVGALLQALVPLLKIRCGDAPGGSAQVADRAAAEFGLDLPILQECLAVKRGRYKQVDPHQYRRFPAR